MLDFGESLARGWLVLTLTALTSSGSDGKITDPCLASEEQPVRLMPLPHCSCTPARGTFSVPSGLKYSVPLPDLPYWATSHPASSVPATLPEVHPLPGPSTRGLMIPHDALARLDFPRIILSWLCLRCSILLHSTTALCQLGSPSSAAKFKLNNCVLSYITAFSNKVSSAEGAAGLHLSCTLPSPQQPKQRLTGKGHSKYLLNELLTITEQLKYKK